MSFLSFIVAAAGQGKRLGAGSNKVFLPLGDKPMINYTLEVAQESPLVNEIIIVTRSEDISLCERLVRDGGYHKVKDIISGGEERQESISKGLKSVSPAAELVAVHDGARPFLTLSLLERVVKAALSNGAAIPALQAKDTVKKGSEAGFITKTLNRNELWLVQTPQIFRRDWFFEAYKEAEANSWKVTDDASLIEKLGYKVKLVTGEETNIKVTTPGDLTLARAILAGVS
ncbi:MAG: 2-C-methyl-D-erythritol 4-phosphate cytidylyltransferase [Clostridia bacterium]|nr:2-C-methyl-D-erythritol 4-phosphate cytidylyltransferase [Clostridia bacterium]